MPPLSRRAFLQLLGVTSAAVGLAACSSTELPAAAAYSGMSADPAPNAPAGDALRQLARVTFGPTPAERALVAEIGLGAWLEQQLAYEELPDWRPPLRWDGLAVRTAFDLLELNPEDLAARERHEVISALRRATLLRRLHSERQLHELMVAFWSDHFNIAVTKGDCWYLKPIDDREVIRKHALSTFGELLHASARSPAMLVYLDNQANRAEAPNENYARELLELHTLGVDGGYGQADVMALARCLTGWTVKAHFRRGRFTFDPARHDTGGKRVLGIEIAPGGADEVEAVLDHLATHPSTARHLATKLVRYFITDNPNRDAPELVARAADTFLRSGGDIRAVLRTVLYGGLLERPADAVLPPRFKRPDRFVLSALRQGGVATDGGAPLHELLARMGQPLFAWPTPDGPPVEAGSWIHGLLPRWAFALALARGELDGTRLEPAALLDGFDHDGFDHDPATVVQVLSDRLLGAPLPPGGREAVAAALREADLGDALPAYAFAALIASPAFQWS